MPFQKLSIHDFLALPSSVPVLDVRSPGEYSHAHIPGAISFPLFTDEERKAIGTSYKQQSREQAIKIGLASFGKNMVGMVEEVEKLLAAKKDNARAVALHCWRGGMRSAAVAWLLDFYGFKVYTLSGGYKAYRHWALQQFEKNYRFRIVGGYTGSNKTGILTELKKNNHAVIDLENLAGHNGSAFGNLNRHAQPTQEMFENLLATELHWCSSKDPIWIEDESQRIGDLNLPSVLFEHIRGQPFVFLDVPFEVRLQHLLEHYGKFEKEKLINAIVRIKKRLGGLEAKTAVNCLLEDDIKGCFAVLLNHYDKIYLRSRLNREEVENKISTLVLNSTRADLNASQLLNYVYGS